MAGLSATNIDKVNRASPVAQEVGLGTELGNLSYAPVILYADITAAANSTAKTFTVPFAMEIVDVIVQARATSGSGTVTIRTGTTAISNAIVMATDKAMTRAGTLDDAQTTLAAGASLNAITNGANDRGLVCIIGKRA